jgi:thiol-disulfide isomerase/thioredoxin
LALGQCEKTKLFNNFNNLQNKYKAVSFVIEKVNINYNSWDLKSETDTFVTKEKFWGIREKNGFKFFKIGLDTSKPYYSSIYYMDTAVFLSNISETYKQNILNSKFTYFYEAFLFLHAPKDTFFKCFTGDSVKILNENSFFYSRNYDDDYGPVHIESQYVFDSNGYVINYENFVNQQVMLPKYYVNTAFSEIQYYKEVPIHIKEKIERSFAAAQKNYIKSKLKKVDSSNYHLISSKPVHLLDIYKYDKIISLDSIVKSNKITLLYFWFDGCSPCHLLKPYLIDIYSSFHSEGLELIGLNSMDNKKFIDSCNFNFINYFDKLKNNKQLNFIGYPTVLVINKNGELLGYLEGYTELGVSKMKKHLQKLIIN